MHFQTSYTTGPSFVLWKAPTGHADAQAGFSQCMHSRRMNLSSLVRTTVYLCADCTGSAATLSSYGSLFCCAQPASHCLQPMHIVASYSRALLMENAPRCSQAGFPFRGMMWQVNERVDGIDSGTVQKTLGDSTIKK